MRGGQNKGKENFVCVLQRNLNPATRRSSREPMLALQALLGHQIPPKIFLPFSLSRGELPAVYSGGFLLKTIRPRSRTERKPSNW